MRASAIILVVLLGTGNVAGAAASSPPDSDPGFTLYSAQALVEQAAHWQRLAPEARLALLTELKARGLRAPRVRTERRYGYRVRQADGRVVTIEHRETVTVDASAGTAADSRSGGFGAGFERRNQRPVMQPANAPGFQPEVLP